MTEATPILYPVTWPATYRDANGVESTVIEYDGERLRTVLRGAAFQGSDFDALEPTDWLDPRLSTFTLNRYRLLIAELCGCVIECDIPVPLTGVVVPQADLHVRLELGLPNERGLLNREALGLSLELDGTVYSSRGTSGWFEDEMLTLQEALPDGVYMSACINCAFSDYSVYGHGLFGNMLCFRNQKAAYLAVQTKDEYTGIMDGFAQMVQETHLCPEFERRVPGTGYRG